jgi:hypothetical protein
MFVTAASTHGYGYGHQNGKRCRFICAPVVRDTGPRAPG